eukprot:Colp12_sorted_trinity150504_noHs@33557
MAIDGNTKKKTIQLMDYRKWEELERKAEKADDIYEIDELTDDGGVQKITKKAGDGAKPKQNDIVIVHYVGKLADGTVFDSSRERKKRAEFRLGGGNMIKGWELALPTMRVGDLAELTIKPEYAYGEAGLLPNIPPNSTLTFDIELLDIEQPRITTRDKINYAIRKKNEGNANFEKKEYVAAVVDYLKAFVDLQRRPEDASQATESEQKEINQLNATLLSNTALCQMRLGNHQDMVETCRQGLHLDENNVKLLYRLGLGLTQLRKPQEAIPYFKKALGFEPDNQDIVKALAEATELRAKLESEKADKKQD